MSKPFTGYKIFTHDWRSPIQGGKPLFKSPTFPLELPTVSLDTSNNECGAGWNFTRSLVGAAKIASFWGSGRPSRCVAVETQSFLERGNKLRSAQLTLLRECSEAEIQQAMRELVSPWAGDITEFLVAEQWAWYVALGRPLYNEAVVRTELQRALAYRGLSWKLKKFDSALAARAARDSLAARDAWDAWTAWAARDSLDAWDSWDARDAWDAWTAWAAWDAWDARDSLVVTTSAKMKWLAEYPHDHLTLGVREAYLNGLELASSTGPNELGWVMRNKG